MNYLPRALRLGNRGILQSALQWSPRQLSSPISLPFRPQTALISTRPSRGTPPTAKSAKDKSQRTFSCPPIPPPSKTEEELLKLKYLVRRTPNLGIPVYRKLKSGKTREIIVLKKIDGDRKKMVEDLIEAVGIPRDDIRINSVTQHIELKGNYLEKTRDWLLQQGF